jgi:ABC-2 type transport system ATP-binding protein
VTPPLAIEVENLRHEYGGRVALADVSFTVRRGEMFGLLGPNGGGKTTLFRILSTLLPPTGGEARVFGASVRSRAAEVRRRLGVVFQRPSLDTQLTVAENLLHHGHLYGLSGVNLRQRSRQMLERLGIAERGRDLVRTLSGGLQRRVELAKGLLHRPELLLLDEPSTGLDPGARRDLLQLLRRLGEEDGVTVALTTHYMEEAERCGRVAILNEGRLVALGAPGELKSAIPGDVVVVEARDPAALAQKIRTRFGVEPARVDGSLRLERPRGHEFVRELVDAFPDEVSSASFGRPTLEDVFIHLTGRRFWTDGASEAEGSRA